MLRTDLDELLDCPFCGGKAEYFILDSRTVGHGIAEDTAGVICTDCNAGLLFSDYANNKFNNRHVKAAALWNRRQVE